MATFATGDAVAFSAEVVRRCGFSKQLADMRGEVVSIEGRLVSVDFGAEVKLVPAANLRKVKAGVVVE